MFLFVLSVYKLVLNHKFDKLVFGSAKYTYTHIYILVYVYILLSVCIKVHEIAIEELKAEEEELLRVFSY